jgi:hypothetical protein
MSGNLAHRQYPDPIRTLSFRAKQADAFSYLPLLRKVGLRREKSLFASAGFIANLLLKRSRLNLLLCSGLLMLTFSLNAQAPVAVPIPKEPHHHLVLENSYVRVFRVSVPAHESTLLHQHDVPYVYVALGPADVINAVQGKPEAHLTMADGQVGYSRGGFAHIARNESGTPFNNVTIELLRPQGEPKNLCDKVVPGDPGPCFHETRLNSYTNSPSFETDGIKVFSLEMQPKAGVQDVPETDILVVALDQAELTVQILGKPEIKLSGGNSLWLSRRTSQTIRNASDRPSRFLSIAFKDSAVGATH